MSPIEEPRIKPIESGLSIHPSTGLYFSQNNTKKKTKKQKTKSEQHRARAERDGGEEEGVRDARGTHHGGQAAAAAAAVGLRS